MNTPFEKILNLIERYDQKPLDIRFRIQTKPNCEDKYKNYIRGSSWEFWIWNPSGSYIDFGQEPTPYDEIKQIQINPIEERDMGKLMLSKVINHKEKVCQLLDEIKIDYEIQDVLICIK